MTTIITKFGTRTPTKDDIKSTGELAIDLTSKKIYTLDGGGEVIQLSDGDSLSKITWGDILDKPDSFPPEDHTHPQSEIDGLEGDLTVINDDIEALQDAVSAIATTLAFGGSFSAKSGTIIDAAKPGLIDGQVIPDASGLPNTFLICVEAGDTPYDLSEGDWIVSNGTDWVPINYVSGSAGSVDWNNVQGKPDFDALYSGIDHTHEISDVNGLEDALADLPQEGHTHTFAEVIHPNDGSVYANMDVTAALNTKASIDQITGGTF